MTTVERLHKAVAYLKGQQIIDIQQDIVKKMKGNKSNISSALKGDDRYLTKPFLRKFSSTFTDISENWLIDGEGSMLLPDNTPPNITKAPNGRLPKKNGTGLVKFYDTDFAAGDIEFYDDTNAINPAYEMDIPEFSGCTAFRTYGDSMEPMIKSGSILFGTRIEDWQSHLEYGQIYGIVCTDKRKYLKYIRKDKKSSDKQFLLRSENEEYDDFELPKDKIKHIWLIHGWINKRS